MRRASSLDAVTVLSVFVLALFAIPSELIVGPLGAAGTPAEIIGVCLFAGWLVIFANNPSLVCGVRQPVRWLLWAFVIAVTLSYIAANSRSTRAGPPTPHCCSSPRGPASCSPPWT
jgi:hypothetical protein